MVGGGADIQIKRYSGLVKQKVTLKDKKKKNQNLEPK
jgi:hypothetical protein